MPSLILLLLLAEINQFYKVVSQPQFLIYSMCSALVFCYSICTRCPTKMSFSFFLALTDVFLGFVHTFCSKITLKSLHRYGAYTIMLCPSQQFHQLKQEKSYFLLTHTFISYNMTNYGKVFFSKKNMISTVLNGGFVEKDRALLQVYAPYR